MRKSTHRLHYGLSGCGRPGSSSGLGGQFDQSPLISVQKLKLFALICLIDLS